MKKSLASYLIPSVLVSILGGAYIIIDGIFIGKYVGDDGLSAINIAWPITAFIQTVGLAIGTSAGVLISIYEGRNDEEKRRKIEWLGIFLLLALSVVLLIILFVFKNQLLVLFGAKTDKLLQYGLEYLEIIILGSLFQVFGMGLAPILRNKGKIKTVMFSMILGTLGNFIGDYLFMAVFDLKLQGAAIASVIGQAVTGIICLVVLLKNLDIKINFERKLIGEILKVFVSPFVLTYSASILLIITNLVCMKYGGSKCVATYTIYSYIIYIIQASSSGCSDGAQPLLSYYYGANDYDKLKRTRRNLYLFTSIFIGLMCIVFLILKKPIVELFSSSSEVISMYNEGYILFFIGLIFISFVKLNCSYLYATENSLKANILVILDPIVINPIFLLVLPILMGIKGIWFSYSLSQILLTILGFLMIFTLKKAKNA